MKIHIQAGTDNFYIAERSKADSVQYHGRLLNSLTISRKLSRLGAGPLTLNLSIKNDDDYISSTIELWASTVTIESEQGYTWEGKVTAYDSDGSGTLTLQVTEKSAPELVKMIPDEVARLFTVDDNLHVSALNVTVPLVVGGNSSDPILVKGILKDKVNGIYLLCTGEIHQVVKVYRGDQEITTGFNSYTGTSGQSNYPGFAYIEITDSDLLKNDDGTYAEISAEVVGLKLGSSTVEECRNGARFLKYFLEAADSGACGWGLNVSSAEIDTTSFNTAITTLDTAGLKMDGIFFFRQKAQAWIDQICQAIRGTYEIGENGLRRLFVNANGSSIKTYTKNNIKLLRHGKGAFNSQVFNKGKLDFDYNPITGQFMQSVFYENSTSISEIGEQEFFGQSYLLKDMDSAQAILDYTCQKSQISAEKVFFETIEVPDGTRTGDIITLDYTERGLSGSFQITSLEISDFKHKIEAEKFDPSIFTSGSGGTAIDWSRDQAIISPYLPAAASGLSLSSGVELDSSGDGSAIPYIEGTFTLPAGKYLGANIYWGEGASPANWNNYGIIKDNVFRISPVKAEQKYTIKIKMFNSSGSSDSITGSITPGSDTTVPPTPSVSAGGGLGCIVLGISISSFSAFSHFEIQREKSDETGQTTLTSDYRGTSFTDDSSDIIADYSSSYKYRVRAYSRSGQASAWSAWTSTVSAVQAESKDITANQIIAKDFRTACNVGNGAVSGVLFNCQGLQAWNGATNTFNIDSETGNVSMTGTITAAAGAIGGWNINAVGLNSCGADSSKYIGLWGAYSGCCPTIVVSGCSATANTYHTFGGRLFNGSWLNDRWGMVLRAGGNNLFQVHADFDGSSLCAQIAGWDFNYQCLYSNNILIDAAGHLQTADFVTGNKGWCIGCAGDAEFNNITARGAIRTAVFIKDEISVVGGKTLIRPATTLCEDDTMAFGGNHIYVEDESQFAIGDLIRMKDGINDYWGCITGCIANRLTTEWQYGCCDYTCVRKGLAVVNYGAANSGGILLDGQCPYIDIYTHSGTPWTSTDSRVRLGNLNGWGSFASDTYGIAVGCPTAENMTYDTASSKLSIVGDIEVRSTGNILSDPDFRGVPYNCDYTVITSETATDVGDYTARVCGTAGVYGVHKLAGSERTQYVHCCSNSLLLYTLDSSSYSQVVSKNLIPIKYGATYTYSAYLAKHSGYCDPRVYIGLCYYDADMTGIGYDYPLLSGCNWSCTVPIRVSAQKTMPANAAYVKVRILNYQPAGESYVYVSGLQLEEGSAASSWKANKGGTITADHVKSGCLTSLNWNGSTAGSCINMNDGKFNFGGGKLTWDGSTLTTCGTVCSTAGCIGGWTIGSSVLCSSDGVRGEITLHSPRVTVYTLGCGGSGSYAMHGRMYWNGCWNQNAWGFSVTNGTSGTLAAGMGYANIGTVTLPDSSTVACGNPFFWVGNTTNYMKWNPSSGLVVKGNVNATTGCIGGWTIGSSLLCSDYGTCGKVLLYSPYATVYTLGYGGSGSYAMHGRMYWDGCWSQNAWGFSVTNGTSGSLAAGMGYANRGTVTLPDSSTVACGNPFFWVGNTTNYMKWNPSSGLVVCGNIKSTTGNIGSFCIYNWASNLYALCSGHTYDANNSTFFKLLPGCSGSVTNINQSLTLSQTIAGSNVNIQLITTNGCAAEWAPVNISIPSSQYYALCTNGKVKAFGIEFNNGSFACTSSCDLYLHASTLIRLDAPVTSVCTLTCSSDKNLKTDIQNYNVLPRLRQMPITKWRFKGSEKYHVGPMSQDFNKIFNFSKDEKSVYGLDGIALKAAQELDSCVSYNNRRILALESRVAQMSCEIESLRKAA